MDALEIYATRCGIITTPRMDRMNDRYVEAVQEWVRVSDPAEKELLVSVAESDLPAYQLASRVHESFFTYAA